MLLSKNGDCRPCHRYRNASGWDQHLNQRVLKMEILRETLLLLRVSEFRREAGGAAGAELVAGFGNSD